MYRTRSTRRGAGLVIIGAAALTLLLSTVARADPAGDKARVDRQLAQTQAALEAATERAKQAVNDYTAAQAALPAAQAALAEARGRAIGAQAAMRQAERDATAARASAQAAASEYARAYAEVDRGREEIADFVAAAYKGSSFVMLNAVLDADTPGDLVNRIGYIDQVADSQQRALAELTAARMLARQRADAADAARDRAETAERVARQALDAALAAQSAAEAQAAAVQALIDQRANAKAVADSERAAVLAQYNNLKTESDRLAEDLRRAGGGGGGGPSDVPSGDHGGFFRMPVAGWKSSNFGMRFDPYYHVWQLHPGTDFAAPNGTAIWAAGSGQVVSTGWRGGYGNYTCVYHGQYQGRGLATCYAHQSRILVSPGQWVARGQVIGRVGTTGASTGYHLHFEVRIDGRVVNPLGWLPGCLC